MSFYDFQFIEQNISNTLLFVMFGLVSLKHLESENYSKDDHRLTNHDDGSYSYEQSSIEQLKFCVRSRNVIPLNVIFEPFLP